MRPSQWPWCHSCPGAPWRMPCVALAPGAYLGRDCGPHQNITSPDPSAHGSRELAYRDARRASLSGARSARAAAGCLLDRPKTGSCMSLAPTPKNKAGAGELPARSGFRAGRCASQFEDACARRWSQQAARCRSSSSRGYLCAHTFGARAADAARHMQRAHSYAPPHTRATSTLERRTRHHKLPTPRCAVFSLARAAKQPVPARAGTNHCCMLQ